MQSAGEEKECQHHIEQSSSEIDPFELMGDQFFDRETEKTHTL